MEMNWKDIIGGIILVVFLYKFLRYYFGTHPSDKYHNGSWRNRNK